ncbi:MAG: DUF1598 domain-containing protein [Pirellulaceae bacterium]
MSLTSREVCRCLFSRTTLLGIGPLCASLGVLCYAAAASAGEPAELSGPFAAHLAAGEFGPAAQLAHRVGDARQRDVWLSQIARAQSQSGIRWASASTAAEITDNRLRSSVFGEIAGRPLGGGDARGGGSLADFDSLIELVTATISPDSWDAVGGPGAVEAFSGGVFVDGSGLMTSLPMPTGGGELASVRNAARRFGRNQDARKRSLLRRVSLTRLERHAERLWAMGKGPDETMRTLAGLQKLTYVLFYPDTRDIVVAGPAGDWAVDGLGRSVSKETGRPVLLLDDLVVVLRNAMSPRAGRFGCSITPRQDNLAALRAFLDESSKRPLRPGQRGDWLDQLRDRLGRQDIQIHGIDPRSRAARVLVEADYHMKLIGMGLEEGTLGVASYLDHVQPAPSGSSPPLDVLRWWFTMNYDAIRTTRNRDAFELLGPGVQVLSENELLAASGRRVHTGKSKEQNTEFAHRFTRHFEALASKYPIYAELQNIFDLALATSLMRSEGLFDRIDWPMAFFCDDGLYQVDHGYAPTQVESVINHRVIDGKRIMVGVSGGVQVDANHFVRTTNFEADDYGLLRAQRKSAAPGELPLDAWWWDG